MAYTPQTSYGSNAVSNRVKPGGSLGSNQYYYKTNAKTGEISVYRYVIEDASGIKVASIPQKSQIIEINSDTTSTETSFFSTPSNIAKVRNQALQIANREWDGRTQPPPNTAIYGENSINKAFDPAGSGTHATSTKNTQTAAGDAFAAGLGTLLGGGSLADAGKSALGGFLGRGRGVGGVVVYPSAIRSSGQDYLKIEELVYEPKKKSQGNKLGWGTRNDGRSSIKTIILPIPGGITDSNAVSWGDDKMNAAETAMANIALAGIEQGVSAGLDEAQSAANAARAGGTEVKDAISKGIAGMASGTGAQLLTRTTGQIMNPNMELLFKDPSLRPFTFTWKLAARSNQEARNIIDIIRTFKKGMAPIKSDANLFLKSPHTWRLTYMHRGSEHKYLNRFKECAMNAFTVQYTPDGNYATFEDGVMTSYQITMSLQELEPVFSNDYDELGSNYGIGY